MSLNKRVRELLHQEGVDYKVSSHEEAFSAQEVAAEADIPGWKLAKVLVLRRGNGTYRMLVLPAPAHLALARYRELTEDPKADLANEVELGRLFPDCEVGAMPPFGNLYGIPVAVDSCLVHGGDFFFEAGNHHQVVRMRYEDFDRIVRPTVGAFCGAHHPALVTG
jgi:Ala-tRNA(Pro) deacylase